MILKLENPRDIYENINYELTILIASLTSMSSDDDLNKAQDDARDKLSRLQVNLKNKLEELQQNSEWSTFTIAFYGETGSGKSTLVETLRILLNEQTKQECRKKFNKIKLSHEKKVALLPNLEAELTSIYKILENFDQQISVLTDNFNNEQLKLTQEAEEKTNTLKVEEESLAKETRERQQSLLSLTQAITDLQASIIKTKAQASLWQKIILLFKKLPEELEFLKALEDLPQAEREIKIYTDNLVNHQKMMTEIIESYNDKCAYLNNQLHQSCQSLSHEKRLVEQTKQLLNQQIDSVSKQIEDQLVELEQCADGEIIGDGRADFTRKTQCYDFNVGQQRFNLLDVPGIEGKEGLVLEEIEKAVQSAHAVFYVTNKAAPPQTGDNDRQGTLGKIKEHLGSQTEVWSVFNKKITNPKYTLKNRELLSDDEKASLMEMDKKMIEQLGKHYQGSISLTALPAFVASTDFLVPNSQDAKRRSKFLEDFSEQELLDQSKLSAFIEMLKIQLLIDSNNKIKKSNFNKVKESLNVSIGNLDDIKTIYMTIADDIESNSESARHQLRTSFDILNSQLQSKGSGLILEVVQHARKHLYQKIESDIKNDNFKEILENQISTCVDRVTSQLPEMIEETIKEFESSVEDVFKRFSELSKEFLSAAGKLGGGKFDTQFNIKVELDSGINKAALVGGLIAAAMVPFTAGASLWLAGAAAFSAVLALGKAVWSFFSNDYKMSEQRKSTDINLRDIENELKTALQKSLNEARKEMANTVAELDTALQSPVKQMVNTIGLLDRSNKKLKSLSKQI
ncbi:hypothetical protein JFQ93_002889 [Aeromonas sobria]|nr:hypothetical protein [Aeromonas sobria]